MSLADAVHFIQVTGGCVSLAACLSVVLSVRLSVCVPARSVRCSP